MDVDFMVATPADASSMHTACYPEPRLAEALAQMVYRAAGQHAVDAVHNLDIAVYFGFNCFCDHDPMTSLPGERTMSIFDLQKRCEKEELMKLWTNALALGLHERLIDAATELGFEAGTAEEYLAVKIMEPAKMALHKLRLTQRDTQGSDGNDAADNDDVDNDRGKRLQLLKVWPFWKRLDVLACHRDTELGIQIKLASVSPSPDQVTEDNLLQYIAGMRVAEGPSILDWEESNYFYVQDIIRKNTTNYNLWQDGVQYVLTSAEVHAAELRQRRSEHYHQRPSEHYHQIMLSCPILNQALCGEEGANVEELLRSLHDLAELLLLKAVPLGQ